MDWPTLSKMSNFSKKDLPNLWISAMKSLGGEGTRKEIDKKIRNKINLNPYSDAFMTLYYDCGWAKTKLKSEGIITKKKGYSAHSPVWYFVK